MTNFTVKTGTATAVGALLALAIPLAASAHVSINPDSAAAGSYTTITVNVPNESATATTTSVELSLPQETPFSSVRYVPVAGWSAELVRETLAEPVMVGDREITEAVTKVVWTADAGSEIADGQLQQFPLSLGPVPDVGSIVFAADQHYSDGEVVSWDERGADAGHPAPVLYVNDKAPADDHGAATEAAEELASITPDDTIARGLGLGGLVLGLAALLLAISARRKAGTR